MIFCGTPLHHHHPPPSLFFSNKGQGKTPEGLLEVPEGGRTARGTAIVNILQLDPDEKIMHYIPVKEFTADKCLIMATKQGIAKKTDLYGVRFSRKNGIIGINSREGDDYQRPSGGRKRG